jgi:hypothetical protein
MDMEGITADTRALTGGGRPDDSRDGEIAMAEATLDQARFWAQVYAEIMVMESGVLAQVEHLLASDSEFDWRVAQTSNVTAIAAELYRFQRRQAAWEGRVRELQQAAT